MAWYFARSFRPSCGYPLSRGALTIPQSHSKIISRLCGSYRLARERRPKRLDIEYRCPLYCWAETSYPTAERQTLVIATDSATITP
jgi:hypothetical protein